MNDTDLLGAAIILMGVGQVILGLAVVKLHAKVLRLENSSAMNNARY